MSSNVDIQKTTKTSKKSIRRGSNSSRQSEDLERMMTGRLSYDSSRNSVPLLSGMNYQDKVEDSDSLPDRIQEGSYHSSQNEYGHSYSFIEFCVKSQIFTREFAETNGRRQSKANQEEADPDLIYSLYIGG